MIRRGIGPGLTYHVAHVLEMRRARLRSLFAAGCRKAIKIFVDRPNISASIDERDVFGARQRSAMERPNIPFYAEALSEA
jgi:hypothetical protein